jgi:hypothetical protein
MNLVLDNATEVNIKKGTRKPIGKDLLQPKDTLDRGRKGLYLPTFFLITTLSDLSKLTHSLIIIA